MGAGVGAPVSRPPFWGASELARLASLALRGDKGALRTLLEKLADIAENARERTASALGALREVDSLLAEGCEKLPEAKAHVRVASSRLQVASEALLEVAAAIGAALALSELSERESAPPAQGGGGS
jgi:HEAT repeat protein